MKNSIFNAVCKTRYLALLVVLILTCGNAWGTTYQHVFNVKPSTGNNISLSSVSWNITAENLGSYNSGNYAGVQLGSSKSNGSITLTTSSAWGSVAGTYKDKTKITEIRLWLNLGGTSVTPSVTIGGTAAVSDGTTVVKNSSAGSDWTKATKVTFTPATGHDAGVVVINVSTVKAGYICCMEIDCEKPGGGTTYTVGYDANGGTGTMENTTGATVNAATCTFTPPTCKVFDHWNTDSNDEGTSYDEGDAVNVSTTLYAIWVNNPSDPTQTFSNGSYTTGGSALDLSTLFSSNSSGAVTYSIANAGGTGASIAGSSFTASSAGSCTVQASQAADAPCYNAKVATATITVSTPTPATITLQNYDGDATTTGYYSGGSFTLPSENDFKCGDLTFVGWSTVAINDPSATKPASNYYEPGESVTLEASNTFYAVFAESGGGGSTTKTDELTYTSFFNACTPTGANTNGSYTEFSGKSGSESDAVYAGSLFQHGNGPANCKDYIQMKSKDNVSGIITTTSGGKAKKVTVEWNSATSNARVVNIYGKNTAYSAASDLYNDATDGDLLGTITNGTSTDYTITGDYEYIGIRSSDGSIYFDAISIDWQAGGGISYSNYTTNCVNMRTVYLDAYHFGDSDGAKFAIYSWKNGSDPLDDKLADAFMTKETDCALPHLYVGEYPDNHDRIIFLRNAAAAASPVKSGANKLNQTSNITTDADKDLFTIASGGGGDTYTGSWSVYTKKYAVTFDKNGVSSTSTWPSDQCKASGEKVTDPNITPQTMGKTFVGWYQEAEGTNAWVFNTNTVTAATTIYAKWNDVATKTIYLDASATLSGDKTWDADNVELFAHAYIDGTSLATDVKATSAISSCQPHVYAFTIPGNATHVSFARCATGTTELPASWTNPPVYGQIAGKTIENGKDNYVIDGWGSATLQNSAFTPTSYTISFAAGDYGSGDAPANDSKACGVAFTLPSTQVFSRNGYTMDGWSVNANGSTKDYNLGDNYTTDADQTFYPHWTEATYGVTLNTNGGTINAGNVTTYTYGTGATLPTDVTKSHATFQGWYAASNFSGDRIYSIGTTEYGAKEYWAKWENITYTVTWKANGETVKTESVVEGNTVTAPTPNPANLANSPDGCVAEFVGWALETNDPGPFSVDPPSSAPSGMFTTTSPAITGDVTFVAVYRQEQ